MLNVVLAEDHTIVRKGVKMLLETDKSIHVIGEATNGIEVLNIMDSKVKADILLTEINIPDMTFISSVKKYDSNVKIIVLSMFNDVQYVFDAFAHGASGYLLKECEIDELFFAIKKVSNGGKYLCTELSVKLLETTSTYPDYVNLNLASYNQFSKRELEILNLIGEGMTNSEMSEKLFLSKRTIEGHRQNLIDKTGSRNTAELIKYVVQNKIIR